MIKSLINCWLLGEQYFNLLQLKMTTLKYLETFCYSVTHFSYHLFAKIVSQRNLQRTKLYSIARGGHSVLLKYRR